MRQSKTPSVEKQRIDNQPLNKSEHAKIVTICLKNVLEGILKRLQSQIITKVMINSAQYSQKVGALRFLSFFRNNLIKRIKQMTFERLRQSKYLSLIKNKAAIVLAFYYRRLVKNQMKTAYYRLRSLKFQSRSILRKSSNRKSAGSIPSPRMSQQSEKSNLLAISQDSISQNNDQQFEDRRSYGYLDFKEIVEQSQQFKRMELSQNFKEYLHKLQRFDQPRNTKSMINALKDPVSDELRRLEKMKSQNENASSKVHDNQLLLSCLLNQIKLFIQQNLQQSFLNLQKSKQNKQILQLEPVSQPKQSDVQYLSNEEKITLNMITAVLKARQFKDIKRQIDYFAKISTKKEITALIKQVAIAFQDFSNIQSSSKSKDKNKQDLNNTIAQLDKYLRTEKYDQIEKLKNKLKNSTHFYQLNALLETIFAMNNELKKYKKKEFYQPERGFTSPNKQKNIEQQNEVLKQQLKSLQIKFKELQEQNEKMKDAMKKNIERVHPSLLPKKIPQKQQQVTLTNSKNEDMAKKYKQLEASMQKKLQSLSKQTSTKLQKAKQDSKKLSQKIKQLQFQMENITNHNKSMALKVKQKEDFLFMYQSVSRKMIEKESFVRDVNEFKKKYSESKFVEIIEKIINEQNNRNSLVLHLKNINTAFQDNSWKRKQNNLFLKTEGQMYANINLVIEQVLSLLMQKQEIKGSQKDIENVKKNQEKLKVQNMNLKEEITALKLQIKHFKEQIEKINSQKTIKSQTSETNSKLKTPEKFNRTTVDKQVSDLKLENQKLKKEIQQSAKSISLEKSTNKLEMIKKQLQEGQKMYEIIKAKRLKSQPFVKEFNEFKRNNLKSIFVQIFQNISKEDTLKSLTINQLKNVSTSFNDNTWKKKQNNLLLKQQNELNLQINNIINLLMTSAKSNQESKYTILTTQLKNIKNMLTDNTWKRRQNSLIIKDQSELHTAVNQIIQFTISQLNEKEQLGKNKNECEQLRGKILKCQTQVATLRQQKNKMKSQQKYIRESSNEKNQKLTLQKQINNQKNQNEQLKARFQETLIKQKQIQSTVRDLLAKTKQFSDLIKLYQTIKQKKILGQTSIKQVNEYKKIYGNSSSVEIVDVMFTNTIQEYNKNSKDIPARKNTQLASYQEKQKELQIQNLREENIRLKSQFKTRPQSPETKEKLNSERQKTLTQMREINELKLQIERIKLENQRIKQQLSNALKTNAQANNELDRANEQLSQSIKEYAKKKEIESTKLNQSLNRKLQQLQNFKLEWQKRENIYISESKQKQQKIKTLQKTYEKVEQQRNNLILRLEQKNQQFQIAKENQQLYLKQREQKQHKIIELQHRFAVTEVDVKHIEGEIQKLLVQKNKIEKQLNDKITEQQREISKLKAVLDQRERHMTQAKRQYELDLLNLRNQLAIQNYKLNQSINLGNQIVQNGKASLKKVYQDFQKIELRKQLELVNQEMATFVRNSENQKRQMRQYMERMSNQMQMQNVLHNEEKKMLREDIERAKNQQYQINQEKLNRLRADIQGLRIENQRLTSIIDHNQQSFHQLINQHRELSLKIEQMEEFNQSLAEQNNQLTQDLYTAGQQKLELALKLQPLQDKLTQLQNQISLALQQKKSSQMEMFRSSQAKQNALQIVITKVTNQNRLLQTKMSNQAKTLLELHQNILRLQSQLNLYRQKESERSNCRQTGQYSNYLQSKLKQQSQEIQRLTANQNKLVYKIENLIKNVNELQRQRVQLLSQKRQMDYTVTKQKVSVSQYLPLQQKSLRLQQILIQKQKQISFLKRNSTITNNQFEQQLKLKQLQEQLRYYQIQSAKYKTAAEQRSKELALLQIKSQQNIKLNIQLKHLNAKYRTLNEDYNLLQQQYQYFQKEMIELKKEKSVLQTHSSQNSLENIKQSGVVRQEEISWLKTQLITKDNQIQLLRQTQLDLTNHVRICQQKIAEYQNNEARYNLEITNFEEAKSQIIDLKIIIQNLQNELQISRSNEKNAIEIQQNVRFQIEELIRQNQLLGKQNQQLLQYSQAKQNYKYALREILFQLNQHYIFQGNQSELELIILQKISHQIIQLLKQNSKIKQKCAEIESNVYNKSWEQPKQEFMTLLQKLTHDLLKYLQHQQLINPEDLNMNLKHLLQQPTNNSYLYLQNLTNFIKNVISSINKDSLNLLMLYSNRIDLIKGSLEYYIRSNDEDSFNQLKFAIQSSLRA